MENTLELISGTFTDISVEKKRYFLTTIPKKAPHIENLFDLPGGGGGSAYSCPPPLWGPIFTVYVLSIAINRMKHVCVPVFIKCNDALMC